MKTTQKVALGILLCLLIGGSFAGGIYVGYSKRPAIDQVTTLTNKTPEIQPGADFSTFWKAWTIINEKYIPNGSTSTPLSVSDQEKVWGAIAGLTKSLGDPYTVFFKPEQSELFKKEVSGQFGGVGMEIGIRDNIITVVAPLKNTPAERAGIKAGDKILKIDEKPTDEMPVDEAVRRIRGEKGTKVKITIFRDKEGLLPEITITRDTIAIPTAEDKQIIIPAKKPKTPGAVATTPGGSSASSTSVAQTPSKDPKQAAEDSRNGIFVIKLFNFGGTSIDIFKDKIQKFINTGSDKLIIDLRGNPGGYLEAAVEIASIFLPKDAIVVRENSAKKEGEILYTSRGYNVFNKPPKVVVLIDRGSASASEILAGALSEHGVAKLVGERSFGKGSVQELIDITPETSLKITIARWYTPEGKSLSNGGLKPDYEIIPTKEDIEAKRDAQFDKAVELLVGSDNNNQ